MTATPARPDGAGEPVTMDEPWVREEWYRWVREDDGALLRNFRPQDALAVTFLEGIDVARRHDAAGAAAERARAERLAGACVVPSWQGKARTCLLCEHEWFPPKETEHHSGECAITSYRAALAGEGGA